MADVARIAGVSLKTVSRMVNNVPTVDPHLVEKVNAAVAELGSPATARGPGPWWCRPSWWCAAPTEPGTVTAGAAHHP